MLHPLPCLSLSPESPWRGRHTLHCQGLILPACWEAGEREGKRHSSEAGAGNESRNCACHSCCLLFLDSKPPCGEEKGVSETTHPGAPPFPVSHPASTQSAPHGHARCTPRDWPRSPSPSCHGKAQPKGSQSSAGQPPARHRRHGEQPLRMALAGQQKGQNRCGHVGLLLGMGRNACLPAGPHESPGLTSPGVVLALCLLHGENALHRNVPACGVLSTSSFSPRSRPPELSQMEWQPRSCHVQQCRCCLCFCVCTGCPAAPGGPALREHLRMYLRCRQGLVAAPRAYPS